MRRVIVSGQRRDVEAPGNPSLLCEFQEWTGFDKACVSDIKTHKEERYERGAWAIECDLFIYVTDFSPGFIEI